MKPTRSEKCETGIVGHCDGSPLRTVHQLCYCNRQNALPEVPGRASTNSFEIWIRPWGTPPTVPERTHTKESHTMTAIDIQIWETWWDLAVDQQFQPPDFILAHPSNDKMGMEPTTLVSHPGDTLPAPVCSHEWPTSAFPSVAPTCFPMPWQAESTVGAGRIVSIISASLYQYFIIVIVYCNDLVTLVVSLFCKNQPINCDSAMF